MAKKETYSFAYDPVAAMQNVPKLLGMELTKNGHEWQGPYYLNGDRHAYRRDKIKVFIGRGSVWVKEEGDRCISLPQWLIEFGGAADFKEAIAIIKGQPQTIEWTREFRETATQKVQYVSPDILAAAKQYPLENCPLFRWMCKMFPEEKVRETWAKYNVTTDSHGNCVYWYVDQNNRILFDKRIAYNEDGHRKKDFFPGRKYRIRDGYGGRCYFGANLVDNTKRVYVAESEKAVLMIDLMYGRQAVATGGKSNLREVDSNMVLLPDFDARDSWLGRGEIWPWWEKWGIENIPEHSDIADMIEWKMLHNKK